MNTVLYYFEEASAPAARLAAELDFECRPVDVRHFPDGESLVRVAYPVPGHAILYRSLNDPNARMVELILAASALRDGGARRITLVAPYLAYMRQDIAFRPGEAVSQRVIGKLIADHFEALVTVDPHLHRTPALELVVPGIAAVAVSAAGTIASMLGAALAPDALLVGPDSESRPWVERVAAPLGLDMIIGEKQRRGDREVELVLPGLERVHGRPVIIVDDVISSGGTLLNCATQLRAAGAREVEAVAAHCLAADADLARLYAGGIARIRATDTVPCPVSAAFMAPALADAIGAAGLL